MQPLENTRLSLKFFTLGNFFFSAWYYQGEKLTSLLMLYDCPLEFTGYSPETYVSYSHHKLQLVIWHQNLLQEHPDYQILFLP